MESNDKMKFMSFFIWPRGTLENIFQAKSLVNLKGGLEFSSYETELRKMT